MTPEQIEAHLQNAELLGIPRDIALDAIQEDNPEPDPEPEPRPRLPDRMAPEDLRAFRISANLTQADLARILNVTTDTIASWELGRRQPPMLLEPALRSLVPYATGPIDIRAQAFELKDRGKRAWGRGRTAYAAVYNACLRLRPQMKHAYPDIIEIAPLERNIYRVQLGRRYRTGERELGISLGARIVYP